FSPEGAFLLVRGTTLDYSRRVLITVALDSSRTERVVDDLRDSAWVGPFSNPAGWLEGGRVWFLSERTGFAHLYTVAATGGAAAAWTSGRWEVQSATLSPDRKTFYLRTNEGEPFQQHFWTIDVTRGPSAKVQVTAAEGRQDVTVSPDGKTLAVLHSEANQPPELYLQEVKPGVRPRRITVTPSEEFRSVPWIRPEIVELAARDGAKVPARLYRPKGPPRGAGVIFVHGAGYAQNVHRWWASGYYREYLFHHLLAARGYAVLDIDYRASQGYGRDWRTAIYRYMGDQDLTDQVDGARWMVQNLGVDSARIGIYGGSYGGFITLMAMFTTPGVFKAGAALRPVTDWAHYNHPYTARILNEPQHDSVAYRRSSPIYFANGLQGHLLIAHGMVDDNVHFQDAVRLAQRLIELRKENWEFAVYPVEPHGFERPTSWMDEYKRILKLFESAL
ncbi:MAG: prolyl oligopeptidase family serine peptidase, partial [Gemmatimonadetes bacterium]|nr:prolyl oligopeptidase family serine peptidase [Gemmatimonadota bacterium]